MHGEGAGVVDEVVDGLGVWGGALVRGGGGVGGGGGEDAGEDFVGGGAEGEGAVER